MKFLLYFFVGFFCGLAYNAWKNNELDAFKQNVKAKLVKIQNWIISKING